MIKTYHHTKPEPSSFPVALKAGFKMCQATHVGLVGTESIWSAQKLLGSLGPLRFNIWGPNYSKALRGPMGYKCTKFVPRGYCSFFARGDRRKRLEKEKEETEKEKEKEKEEEEERQQEENINALFHRHRWIWQIWLTFFTFMSINVIIWTMRVHCFTSQWVRQCYILQEMHVAAYKKYPRFFTLFSLGICKSQELTLIYVLDKAQILALRLHCSKYIWFYCKLKRWDSKVVIFESYHTVLVKSEAKLLIFFFNINIHNFWQTSDFFNRVICNFFFYTF